MRIFSGAYPCCWMISRIPGVQKSRFQLQLGSKPKPCSRTRWRKRIASLKPTVNNENTPPVNKVVKDDSFRCYGCQLPRFIRRKCPMCNPSKNQPHARVLSFVYFTEKECPAVNVSIQDFTGAAFTDTGACTSLALTSLYKLLQKVGYKFETSLMDVTLAEGNTRNQPVQMVTARINLDTHHFPCLPGGQGGPDTSRDRFSLRRRPRIKLRLEDVSTPQLQ